MLLLSLVSLSVFFTIYLYWKPSNESLINNVAVALKILRRHFIYKFVGTVYNRKANLLLLQKGTSACLEKSKWIHLIQIKISAF